MRFNKYVFMNEENGGEAEAGGGAPDAQNGDGVVLDGGDDGKGGTIVEFGSEGYKYGGKYDTPEQLEQGYSESVKMHTQKMQEVNEKLKGFAGAPDGDYELPDGASSYSQPVMDTISEWGRENGLSQDAYGELLQKVAKSEADNRDAFKSEQMEKLGQNAQTRIDNINDKWAATYGSESLEVMNSMAATAEGVEFFESILAQGSPSTVNPDGSQPAAEQLITQEQLSEAMFAKDTTGMMKMQTDPEYKKRVDLMTAKYNKQRKAS